MASSEILRLENGMLGNLRERRKITAQAIQPCCLGLRPIHCPQEEKPTTALPRSSIGVDEGGNAVPDGGQGCYCGLGAAA